MRMQAKVGVLLTTAIIALSTGCKNRSKKTNLSAAPSGPAQKRPQSMEAKKATEEIDPKPLCNFATLSDDTDPPCYEGGVFACQVEWYIVQCTNQLRIFKGLKPLKHHTHLAYVARDWSAKLGSKQIATKDGFVLDEEISHFGFPDDRSAVYRTEFKTMEGIMISGENVLMSDEESPDPKIVAGAITSMWWYSASHKDNMLSKDAVYLGAGLAPNIRDNERWWWATQLFAMDEPHL